MQPRAQRRCSLPIYSQKDNGSPVGSLPVINVTDENDMAVSSDTEEWQNQHGRKALACKKHWYRRMLSLKDDIETAYARLGSQIKSGFNNMKTHLTPSPQRRLRNKSSRCLIVHYSTEDKKHRRRKSASDDEDQEIDNSGCLESMEKNYSPSLVMHPLKEGKFSAHISLNSFPSEDNIVVKVRGYKLNIFQQKNREETKDGAKDKQKHGLRSLKCGEIDLPIYVDPSTLKFTVDSECDLYIQGQMKGSMGQRLSLSADDLIINGIRPNVNSPLSQKKNKSIWYLQKAKEAEDKDTTVYRERAYTSAF